MKKVNEVLVRQTDATNNTNGSENVQPATKVYICHAGTKNLATLYSDNGVTQTDNPIITDDYGRYSFFIKNGKYDFYINLNRDTEFLLKSAESIYDVNEQSTGFRVVGSFANGFTYEFANDVGVDASGNYWIYTDVSSLPFAVTAGTVPSTPVYTQVTFNAEYRFNSVLAMKSAIVAAGDIVETSGYYDGWSAQLAPSGGARYSIASLQSVRDAKGDQAWIPDEFGDHTLNNGLIAMQIYDAGISIDKFGAKQDYLTDNTQAIQAAHNACVEMGGGDILIPAALKGSEYGIGSAIIQDSKTRFVGVGDQASRIKALPSFSDSALIKSKDFAALTGSGKWLVSDGVKHGLGFDNVLLDGAGKAVRGVNYYAKRLKVGTLYIINCANGGWYSEAGAVTGQSNESDMPESKVEYLSVRECGGTSIEIRGPHDSFFEKLVSRAPIVATGTVGVAIKADGSTYSANGDFGEIHVYGHEKGVITDAAIDQVKFNLIIAESCTSRGITLNGSNHQISKIELYKNNTAANAEAFNLLVNGDRNQIDNIRINDTSGGGGIKITGDRNRFAFSIDGVGNAPQEGVVRVSGNNNKLAGRIFNTTGTALWTNPGAAVTTGNRLEVDFENCQSMWRNDVQGISNVYDFTYTLSGGQSAFTGVRPKRGLENVKMLGTIGGALSAYPQAISQVSAIDLTSTTQQVITVSHNSPFQPYIESVSVNIGRNTNVSDFAFDYTLIESTSTTGITVKVKLSAASATGGAVADLFIVTGL